MVVEVGSGRWLRGAAFVMNIVVAAPLIQSGDEERLHGAILWVFEIYWPVLNSLGRSIVCCVFQPTRLSHRALLCAQQPKFFGLGPTLVHAHDSSL